jgi:hypothetical protein
MNASAVAPPAKHADSVRINKKLIKATPPKTIVASASNSLAGRRSKALSSVTPIVQHVSENRTVQGHITLKDREDLGVGAPLRDEVVCPQRTIRKQTIRKGGYPLIPLPTFILSRTVGLAASPGSCRTIRQPRPETSRNLWTWEERHVSVVSEGWIV